MDRILEVQIKASINALKGINFQEFVNQLLIKKYGKKFTPIKAKRDGGCDGIIANKVVVAAYSPEKANLNEFKRKFNSDYEKYKINWKRKYPKYCFIYNGEFTADMSRHIDSVDPHIEKWDTNQIIDDINKLQWTSIRDLTNYLGVSEEYVINDILKQVIEDLLKNQKPKPIQNKKATYIEDKIKINYNKKDVESVVKEYEQVLPNITELRLLLKSYDNDEIAALKSRILIEFSNSSGNFKRRFNNLNRVLSGSHSKDNLYTFYLRVVIYYMFETCIIGKRVENEK